MKRIISLKVVFLFFCLFFVSLTVKAQDEMKKPDPIKNETVDMIVGKWVAEPYDMMGSKWTEEANHYMKYGQFMFIDISGKDDKGSTYNGTVVVKLSTDGSFTGWSIDDWGSVETVTGKTNGNKISVSGKSDWGSSTRDVEINGNTMVHKLSWTMKGKDGKDMTVNQTITYHKQ